MKTKKAFSMSEALITLIIIGVIAALVIPGVANSLPEKDKNLYLKAFHTIESINADIIKDGTRYDQDIDAVASLGFHQAPLRTAQVNFSNVTLTKANAYCYFVAEQLNYQGTVNCANGNVLNVQTINNICYRNLAFSGNSENSVQDIVVDIGCKNDSKHKYAIRVSAMGRTTVPSAADVNGNLVNSAMQRKAANWIESQDEMKRNN